jgi:hypothetical protein
VLSTGIVQRRKGVAEQGEVCKFLFCEHERYGDFNVTLFLVRPQQEAQEGGVNGCVNHYDEHDGAGFHSSDFRPSPRSSILRRTRSIVGVIFISLTPLGRARIA